MFARSSRRAAYGHSFAARSILPPSSDSSSSAPVKPTEPVGNGPQGERPRRRFNPREQDGAKDGQNQRPRSPRRDNGQQWQGNTYNRPQNQGQSAINWLSVDEFGGSSSLTARLVRSKGGADQLLKMLDGQFPRDSPGAPKLDLTKYLGDIKTSEGTQTVDRGQSRRQQRSGSKASSVAPSAVQPASQEPAKPDSANAHAELTDTEIDASASEASNLRGSMKVEMTDLDKLFGTVPAAHKQQPIKKPKVTTSKPSTPKTASGAPMTEVMAARVQRILEVKGGDYSRYLPAIQGLEQPEHRTPLSVAQLVMARRREAGLRQRRNALGLLQKQIVSGVQERPTV